MRTTNVVSKNDNQQEEWLIDWLIELKFYVPPDSKYVISEMFFPANLLV